MTFPVVKAKGTSYDIGYEHGSKCKDLSNFVNKEGSSSDYAAKKSNFHCNLLKPI